MVAANDQLPAQLLDVDDVARVLRIPRRSVYVLVERLELEHIRIGRRVRVEADALARYIERGRREALP